MKNINKPAKKDYLEKPEDNMTAEIRPDHPERQGSPSDLDDVLFFENIYVDVFTGKIKKLGTPRIADLKSFAAMGAMTVIAGTGNTDSGADPARLETGSENSPGADRTHVPEAAACESLSGGTRRTDSVEEDPLNGTGNTDNYAKAFSDDARNTVRFAVDDQNDSRISYLFKKAEFNAKNRKARINKILKKRAPALADVVERIPVGREDTDDAPVIVKTAAKAVDQRLAVPYSIANWEPEHVTAGTRLIWKNEEDPRFEYKLFFYEKIVDQTLIYTYKYESESNWTTYSKADSITEWTDKSITLPKEGFVRLVIRPKARTADNCLNSDDAAIARLRSTAEAKKELGRSSLSAVSAGDRSTKNVSGTDARSTEDVSGTDIRSTKNVSGTGTQSTEDVPDTDSRSTDASPLSGIFEFRKPEAEHHWLQCFRDEVRSTAQQLKACREEGDTVFFLLSDTHYAVNSGWDDTVFNLKKAAEVCHPDAIIHLGDMTDGLLPGPLTRQFASRMLRDMREVCSDLYCCVGNHDTNYMRRNPDRFSETDRAYLYLSREKEYYFEDMEDKNLRMIFLSSFDPAKKARSRRYGYSPDEVKWLDEVISGTPADRKVIVFSHLPLLPWMHHWSADIRGCRKVIRILENFQNDTGNLIAFIHGHNHADQVEASRKFPIISVGASKQEYFEGKQPRGSVRYEREEGTLTQELWDIVRVSSDGKTLDFIRFGAGDDRHIERV